ncbi:MAG TPA: histidine--tRNA ligase [Syntrophorhabdales bacterium]|nr:histidine--tRNA ligase [Syntrophorhabdales bacterium]
MEKITSLRGFRDISGEEAEKFVRVEQVSRAVFELSGFREISTPILEKTELFKRSIGDTTDIVEKEMFTFIDRNGDSLTLRPEATAGIVRHYLQEGLHARERISRLFTIGPMFRHERPQKGRFRQFHQVDVEVFGAAEPIVDAELLWIIARILGQLAVKRYAIELNSVGCKECRAPFREVLVSYFSEKKESLCPDCQNRLIRNPLRIFDCKSQACIDLTKGSPLLFDHLCENCRVHFETLISYLAGFGIDPVVNKRLVRGLDYYTRTVFEVTSEELGAQKAFLAGGRYDNLVEDMGGPSAPGIGFAIGMERLALLMDPSQVVKKPRYFLALIGDKTVAYRIPIIKVLAEKDIPVSYSPDPKSLKSQMRHADSIGADYAMILGEGELEKGVILVRDMRSGKQAELPLDITNLAERLHGLSLE